MEMISLMSPFCGLLTALVYVFYQQLTSTHQLKYTHYRDTLAEFRRLRVLEESFGVGRALAEDGTSDQNSSQEEGVQD